MKIVNVTVWAYGLLGLMTLGYFSFLLLATDSVNDIIKRNFATGAVPGPTRLFTTTDAAWVWSILAIVSLIGNMAWGRWRARCTDLQAPHLLPIICHLLWIVTWSFFHILGFCLIYFKMPQFT
jgi:hypothetical protein